jgi:hypothetical protein
MDRDKKRQDDELLVTHPPRQPIPDAGGEPVPSTTGGELSLDDVRRRLLAGPDAAERAALLRRVQARFGNEAAASLIEDARTTRAAETEPGGTREPPPEKSHEES